MEQRRSQNQSPGNNPNLKIAGARSNLPKATIKRSPILQTTKKLLFQPPYIWISMMLCIVFILGYFECSILWCLIIGAAINSTSQVLLKREIRKVYLAERALEVPQERIYPSVESCEWLNTILRAVYGNHHKYISHLFVRFANPLLQKLCTPAPIESVGFEQLDVGVAGPKLTDIIVAMDNSHLKFMNFDFTVDYSTDFQGIVVSRLTRTPDIPVNISNLQFRCRMRFRVGFTQDKFPFLSSLAWSLLDRPEIDISVRAYNLPGYMEMPSITEHFLNLVKNEMYTRLGGPSMVVGKFLKYSDDGDLNHQSERFLSNLQWLVEQMIKHGELVAMADSVPPITVSSGGIMGAVSRAKRRIMTKDKSMQNSSDQCSTSTPSTPQLQNQTRNPSPPQKPRERLKPDSIIHNAPVEKPPSKPRRLNRSQSFDSNEDLKNAAESGSTKEEKPPRRRYSSDFTEEEMALLKVALRVPSDDSVCPPPQRRLNIELPNISGTVLIPNEGLGSFLASHSMPALAGEDEQSVSLSLSQHSADGANDRKRPPKVSVKTKLKRVFS